MFHSAKQKISRADYHIADLEGQFAAFVAEKPHKFITHADPEGGMSIQVRLLKEPPSSLALIIGDAIHNLRCALEHAIWELVGRDHGTQNRHLKFPTGDTRVSFEAACNGIITPSQWVKDTIRATEAFNGAPPRGGRLYDLHALDNSDKHTVIAPVMRATKLPSFSILGPDGKVSSRMEGNTIIAGIGPGGGLNVAKIGPGFSVELDDDAECPPSIFIQKPNTGNYVAVFDLLRTGRDAVVDVLEFLERAAAKHDIS